MDVVGHLELQQFWNIVDSALFGKKFGREWYNKEGKVHMVITAGEEADAEHIFREALGKYVYRRDYGSDTDKEKEKQKIVEAFELYLSALKV
jgi:hypothetical protein